MRGGRVCDLRGARQRVLVGTLRGADAWSPARTARLWRFGPGARDLGLREIVTTAAGTTATLTLPDGGTLPLRLQVPGVHNLRNATAAMGVVVALGGNPIPALAALAAFTGVGRRSTMGNSAAWQS